MAHDNIWTDDGASVDFHKFESIALQRESYYVGQAISDMDLVKQCNITEARCEWDRILYRKLQYDVLTENLKESLEGTLFPNWWDHFKCDVLNPILKYIWNSWQVSYQMEELKLTAKALYPKLSISLKDKSPVVRFEVKRNFETYE